ncbi:MAG: ATP-binding cassette domain-containing protein [Pseudomonadota bacterium]
MAPPLLQLSDIALTWGGDPVFRDLSLLVQPGDRLALVGRNGSGKSTLLKVMAGDIEADTGARAVAPGTQVARLAQDPDMSAYATLGDFAARGIDPSEVWRTEAAANGIGIDLGLDPVKASGGERRRAALAGLAAAEADLVLLDEPTNHLDLPAILWLENWLAETRAAFILISHDRAVLSRLTGATLWLDRGQVRRQEKGFGDFEAWRDQVWAEEDLARHKLDRKIKAEARWAVEGISARRKRNQGRVRALAALRETRAFEIRRQGTAAMALADAPQSGKKVIEARGISKSVGGRVLFQNLDVLIGRGDRVALIGPNGAGKTTLLNCLIGRADPDTGDIKRGTGLLEAVFDQARDEIPGEATLWEALTGDKAMRVSGRADQVMVRGIPRHVVGYLKDFLFDEAQARAPVRALSGGERARLLLAKLMAREANLLVLDEPTNDLDIETLDLLQELIDDYAGTVLLVSHDRDFIDRVATQTLVFDGKGKVTPVAGGWDQARAEWSAPATQVPAAKPPSQGQKKPAPKSSHKLALTFTERHRLDALPGEIERLEAEIKKLETLLSDPDLYTKDPTKFATASKAMAERQDKLRAAEEDWLTLAEKAETAG